MPGTRRTEYAQNIQSFEADAIAPEVDRDMAVEVLVKFLNNARISRQVYGNPSDDNGNHVRGGQSESLPTIGPNARGTFSALALAALDTRSSVANTAADALRQK